MSSINQNSREPRLQSYQNPVRTPIFFCLRTFTIKVIARVSSLWLEQDLRCGKVNSNIYKVMFHEVQLIPMFLRLKWATMRRLQNGSCAISTGRDCRRPCVKNSFWMCFVAPSQQHMFPSGCRVPVTVLNEYKLFPWSSDDGAILNTHL